MKKVGFYTLGCKVNQYETNAMIQLFEEAGFEIVDFDSYADIYVINTCTVTNMSDRKSRQVLRKAKDKNNNSIIVAVGCYVQVAKKELEEIPEIDLCLGTNEKKDIVSFVNKYIEEKENEIDIDDVFKTEEYSEFGNITYISAYESKSTISNPASSKSCIIAFVSY